VLVVYGAPGRIRTFDLRIRSIQGVDSSLIPIVL
jgi:hypothetical protein